MNAQNTVNLEMQESFIAQAESSTSISTNKICLCCLAIINLDTTSSQQHHYPIFIIIMCILHGFTHLCTYIKFSQTDQSFHLTLIDIFQFFVPCMRPTPVNTRIRTVYCHLTIGNQSCLYDDILKNTCYSFMYPHQLWRFVTGNLVHVDWIHLLANISQQLLYGIPLERRYGSFLIIVIYWLSEFGSSLSFMVKNRTGCKYS